jgi:hypothetical protein
MSSTTGRKFLFLRSSSKILAEHHHHQLRRLARLEIVIERLADNLCRSWATAPRTMYCASDSRLSESRAGTGFPTYALKPEWRQESRSSTRSSVTALRIDRNSRLWYEEA